MTPAEFLAAMADLLDAARAYLAYDAARDPGNKQYWLLKARLLKAVARMEGMGGA